MAGKNLKQLLEKAKEAMRKNEPSDCFLILKESLKDDFYWEAMSMELSAEKMDGDYDFKQIKTMGYGQTPEEALIELIRKLSNNMYQNDKLWTEIEKSSVSDTNQYLIELSKLRKILEKYKILKDEKDGM